MPTPEPKQVSVIDVTGVNKDPATSMLGNLQVDIAFVGEGSTVDSQDPAPSTEVDPGATVTLTMRLSDQEVADAAAEAAAAAKAATAAAETAAAAAAEEDARGTVSQQNALRSTESSLAYTAFSHSGLVDQLKYEGPKVPRRGSAVMWPW